MYLCMVVCVGIFGLLASQKKSTIILNLITVLKQTEDCK